MNTSANLALPFIEGGELLPDVTLNETLRLLDTLVQLAIVDRDLNAPPMSPAEGQRWIVKASPTPTGAWSGHGNQIAAWQDGGWVFCVPQTGWFGYVIDEGALLAWSGTAWVNALATLSVFQNLSLLGIGATADATNPFSAKLNNALWAAKTVAEGGDGHLRLKLSKESAAKTLSLLMQNNFSGRAEVGLAGDDDFHFKVSPDGSSWTDAIVIDKSTGKLALAGFTNPTATRQLLAAAPLDAGAYNGIQVDGGMEVSQENGTASVTLTASGSLQTKYLTDSLMAACRGSFVAVGQQVTDAPPGYRNSVKLTVSTAQASLGANDELSLLMPIEGVRTARLAFGVAAAAAVSFGFWVKAHRTGTYSGSLRNSAKARSYPFSFTVIAADTWEFKTVTVPGDTSGTWLNTTGVGLYLNICVAGGSSRIGSAGSWSASDTSGATGQTNGVAATSDTFQITGLIVLPGLELPDAVRSPLIMRPFSDEYYACQRYWQKTYDYGTVPGSAVVAGSISGLAGATTAISLLPPFCRELRMAPTVSLWSANGSLGTWTGAGNVDTATASAIFIGAKSLLNISSSSLTSGSQYYGHWALNARL